MNKLVSALDALWNKLLGALGALGFLVFATALATACSSTCTHGAPGDGSTGSGSGSGSGSQAPQGSIAVSWVITVQGLPTTCALVGARDVLVGLHPRGGGSDVTTRLDCTAGAGAMVSAAAGPYIPTFTLMGAADLPIAVITGADVLIDAGNVTAAPLVTFDVPVAEGRLVLSMAALGRGSNCQSPSGNPLTGHTVTLTRADGLCVDAVGILRRAGKVVGEYKLICSTPQVAPCIEQDETLEIPDLFSGPYMVSVAGLVSARTCWLGQDALSVAGTGVGTTAGVTRKLVQLEPIRGFGC